MKLGAKRAELAQKFVPRSRVGTFRNERTRSTLWTLRGRFGAFRTICVHLGLFGCHTTLNAKRVKLVQKFVPRSRFGMFRNERTRSSPLDPKLKILVRFVLFGCICYRLVALQNSMQNGPN